MKKYLSFFMIFVLAIYCGPSIQAEEETVTVTVSVYEHINECYLTVPVSVTLSEKKTPIAALHALHLEIEASGGYVRGVNGLRERAHGPYSGWVYEVNGVRPPTGAGTYRLKDGDTLCWRYAVTAEQAGLDPVVTTAAPATGKPPVVTQSTQQVTSQPDKQGNQESITSAETSPAEPEETSGFEDTQVSSTKAPSVTQGTISASVSVNESIRQASEWLRKNPGTWAPFALYAAGEDTEDFRESYLQEVKDGLSYALQTDLERYALNLGACGISPENMEGENLLKLINRADKSREQGVNALIYGLITLTAFHVDEDDLVAFVEEITSIQGQDGGFSLSDTLQSDVDLTAAAVISLLPYRETPGVSEAINRALSWLLSQQEEDGAFSSAMSEKNAESTAQVLIAFVLSGEEMLSASDRAAKALLSFQNTDGGFAHLTGGESDSKATEQAVIALATYRTGEDPYYFSALPEEPEEKDTAVLWYWIGGGTLLLALSAAGGIIFWRKKRETN